MCGIAAIIDFSKKTHVSRDLLIKMANFLRKRGPDNGDYYEDNNGIANIGLAHKRLSIIDLTNAANQPMFNNNKTNIIVFNGEIYNYKQIKYQLIGKYNFKTSSDTEVVLACYEVFGIEKTLELIQGMFAFVIYDYKKNSCIAARDRLGEKPLYYYYKNNLFVIGSDIRSFKELNLGLTIDKYSAEYYFQELTTPIDRSIFNEVKKLKPGSYININEGSFHIIEYWNLNYKNKHKKGIKYSIEICEKLLKNAVKNTLTADVKVGAFLSGGLDSTLVSLFAAEQSMDKIDTFSVGFDFEKYNELKYAKIVSEKINSNHHELFISDFRIDEIDYLINEFGEPFADSSMIPTYYIAKHAKKSVKVALGGDAGDELFGGYGSHNQGLRMQKWHNNNWIKPLLTSFQLLNNSKIKYLSGVMNFDTDTIALALKRGLSFSKEESEKLLNFGLNSVSLEFYKVIKNSKNNVTSIFDAILYGSVKSRLVNDYFVKTDRATMANSLELRTPFADQNLLEFCATIPYQHLMHKSQNKFITKKIAEKYFTKDFVYRKKMGFEVPIGHWIKTKWKNRFYDVLLSKQNKFEFNYKFIKDLLDSHCNEEKDHTHKLWSLYVFKKWLSNN